jgi:aspartyl-tRNA(Asn)/glutamyl-tRNA(Gln) amidotransferase subunit A
VPAHRAALEQSVEGLVVALPAGFALARVQPDVAAAVRTALGVLESVGVQVVEVEIPELHDVRAPWLLIHTAEPSAYHAEWLRTRPEDYGDDVRALLEAGETLRAVDYLQAQRFRTLLRARLLDALRGADALLTPTMPFTAPALDAETIVLEDPAAPAVMLEHIARYTAVPSTAGLPGLSVPCGFGGDGLPIGMQLIGRPFEEDLLLRLAHAYQQATDHHLRAPAL